MRKACAITAMALMETRINDRKLAADTASVIAQLDPPPTDLRNRKALRLTTDKARFKAIRKGHLGTGMFPDTTMTTQELTDTLAYLALLRSEGFAKRK